MGILSFGEGFLLVESDLEHIFECPSCRHRGQEDLLTALPDRFEELD